MEVKHLSKLFSNISGNSKCSTYFTVIYNTGALILELFLLCSDCPICSKARSSSSVGMRPLWIIHPLFIIKALCHILCTNESGATFWHLCRYQTDMACLIVLVFSVKLTYLLPSAFRLMTLAYIRKAHKGLHGCYKSYLVIYSSPWNSVFGNW